MHCLHSLLGSGIDGNARTIAKDRLDHCRLVNSFYVKFSSSWNLIVVVVLSSGTICLPGTAMLLAERVVVSRSLNILAEFIPGVLLLQPLCQQGLSFLPKLLNQALCVQWMDQFNHNGCSSWKPTACVYSLLVGYWNTTRCIVLRISFHLCVGHLSLFPCISLFYSFGAFFDELVAITDVVLVVSGPPGTFL